MAAQILHKSTKQNIYKYQACWDINNFSTFYPKPIVQDVQESNGSNVPQKMEDHTFADFASAPLSPFGFGMPLYPTLVNIDRDSDNNKLSNLSPVAEKLSNKVIGFSTLNISTPAKENGILTLTTAGAGVPVHQSRLPTKLFSPDFKFKIGKSENFIESSLKLVGVQLDDNSGDYRLRIETTVFWTKAEYNESWDGNIQIDLLNSDGEVVATPLSAIMLPSDDSPSTDEYLLTGLPKLRPAYQNKIGVEDTLGTMWDKHKNYFADDVLRIRVSLTLFGKIFNEEEPFTREVEKPSAAAVNRFTKDMLILLESESGADVILMCKESKYEAHSAILAARSPTFAKMIKLAARTADTGKFKIQIKDMKPLVLRCILRYLYATEFKAPSSMSRMAWICQMLKAADKFELDEIKPLCYDTIRANLSLDSCGEVAVKAWEHDADSKSKRIISDYLSKHWIKLTEDPDFVSTVKGNPEVFAVQTTARALRATEAEKAVQKKSKKKKSSGFFFF